MRYIKYALLVVIGIGLLLMALANRQAVTLQLMPDEIAGLIAWPDALNTLSLPMYVVVFAAIILGLVIGFLWEWLREHKHRAAATRNDREARKLQQELNRLKDEKNEGQDEVLTLLEKAG